MHSKEIKFDIPNVHRASPSTISKTGYPFHGSDHRYLVCLLNTVSLSMFDMKIVVRGSPYFIVENKTWLRLLRISLCR